MTMDTHAKIQHLRDAAHLIRIRGLAQGVYREEDEDNPKPPLECPHCIIGALLDVAYPGLLVMKSDLTPVETLVGDLMEDVALEIDPDNANSTNFSIIGYWNDKDDRTAEEAAELLERVAAKLEGPIMA
jgi:hypothetical protein